MWCCSFRVTAVSSTVHPGQCAPFDLIIEKRIRTLGVLFLNPFSAEQGNFLMVFSRLSLMIILSPPSASACCRHRHFKREVTITSYVDSFSGMESRVASALMGAVHATRSHVARLRPLFHSPSLHNYMKIVHEVSGQDVLSLFLNFRNNDVHSLSPASWFLGGDSWGSSRAFSKMAPSTSTSFSLC